MRRTLVLAALVLAAGCADEGVPAGEWQRLAASDAVKVLRADESPDRIIYSPPVDLARKAAR